LLLFNFEKEKSKILILLPFDSWVLEDEKKFGLVCYCFSGYIRRFKILIWKWWRSRREYDEPPPISFFLFFLNTYLWWFIVRYNRLKKKRKKEIGGGSS